MRKKELLEKIAALEAQIIGLESRIVALEARPYIYPMYPNPYEITWRPTAPWGGYEITCETPIDRSHQ